MTTLRILIANDYEAVRDRLRALLQHCERWEICGEATNGTGPADKAAQLKSTAIILDIGMPGLDDYLKPKDSTTVFAEATQDPLTRREREVVQLVSGGKTTKEVAGALGISVKTAETHRSNIMRKLDFHSVSQLVLYAVRNNMIPLWPSARNSISTFPCPQ